jgi:hypothetical protein
VRTPKETDKGRVEVVCIDEVPTGERGQDSVAVDDGDSSDDREESTTEPIPIPDLDVELSDIREYKGQLTNDEEQAYSSIVTWLRTLPPSDVALHMPPAYAVRASTSHPYSFTAGELVMRYTNPPGTTPVKKYLTDRDINAFMAVMTMRKNKSAAAGSTCKFLDTCGTGNIVLHKIGEHNAGWLPRDVTVHELACLFLIVPVTIGNAVRSNHWVVAIVRPNVTRLNKAKKKATVSKDFHGSVFL